MAGSQRVAVAGEAGSAQGKRRTTALFVVMLAVAMDLVDTSAVNVALPSLRPGFHMSGSGLQWVVAGYAGGSLGAFTWAAGSALLLLALIAMGAQFVPRHFRNDKELTSGS